MFYQKKNLLENVDLIKRLEYFLLDKELKKQTSVAEKQYQKFDQVFELIQRKMTKKVVLNQSLQ